MGYQESISKYATANQGQHKRC